MIIYDNDDNWRDYDMAPRDRRLFNLWTFLIQFHWTASLFTRLVVYESGMVGGGVIISVFKVFICLIRRVLLTSERGPLYRYPSRLIYWCIYSELSIVGLLWKKGVLYLFVSYQGYYKRVFLIGHWLVLALMVRVRDY